MFGYRKLSRVKDLCAHPARFCSVADKGHTRAAGSSHKLRFTTCHIVWLKAPPGLTPELLTQSGHLQAHLPVSKSSQGQRWQAQPGGSHKQAAAPAGGAAARAALLSKQAQRTADARRARVTQQQKRQGKSTGVSV